MRRLIILLLLLAGPGLLLAQSRGKQKKADQQTAEIFVADCCQLDDQYLCVIHFLLSVWAGNTTLFFGRNHCLTQFGDRQHYCYVRPYSAPA